MHCALILALTTAVTGTLRAADPTRQQDAAGQQQAPSPGQNSAAACRETAKKLPQLGKDPIREVIDAMTIEEKVHLLVGAGTSATDLEAAIIGQTRKLVPGAAGTTFPIERLGVGSAFRPHATVPHKPFTPRSFRSARCWPRHGIRSLSAAWATRWGKRCTNTVRTYCSAPA